MRHTRNRNRLRTLLTALAFMAFAGGAAAGGKGAHSEAGWREWRAGVEANYASTRLAILKASDALYLKPGERAYLVSRADGSLALSLASSRADILSIAFDGERAMLERGAGAFDFGAFIAESKRYPVSARYDLAGGPTQLAPGEPGFRVMAFDQERSQAAAYGGSNWFDYDSAYIIKVRFVPAEVMEKRVVATERGLKRAFYLAGHAQLKTPAGEVALPLYAYADTPEKIDTLFVSFTDETTGNETYWVGRYLDIEEFGAFPPKTLTIDFNRAYNPYCARSEQYNCPLALTALPFAVRAGEKTP